jgi:hypothetical protein
LGTPGGDPQGAPGRSAAHIDGRQIAVEIQLANQSVGAYVERSRRILADNVMPVGVAVGRLPVFQQFNLASFSLDSRPWVRAGYLPMFSKGESTQWGDVRSAGLGEYLTATFNSGEEWPWLCTALPAPARPAGGPIHWRGDSAVGAGLAELDRQAGEESTRDAAEAIRAHSARLLVAGELIRGEPDQG